MREAAAELVTRAGARDLGLDLFHPADTGKRTAIILLHGGGWAFGSRQMTFDYAQVLSGLGFLAIAAEYRLIGEAPWPAQIVDVKDCIRWVRENAARLNIDPDKIVVEGFSAGGHLAMLAGGTSGQELFGDSPTKTSSAVAAVVSFFAPADFSKQAMPVRPPMLAALFGPDGNEDLAIAASPATYVAPGFPPTFLLAGTADKMIPPAVQLGLYQALSNAGTKVELHLYAGEIHEFCATPSFIEPVQREVALFVDRLVSNPKHYADEALAHNIFLRPGGPA